MAGNGTYGYSGDGGPATSARFEDIIGVTLDSAGNIYIADTGLDSTIRKVTASTGIVSTVAGNGTYGYSGDGGKATSAEFRSPADAAVDNSGNIFAVDSGNNRIRAVGH